MLTIFETYLKLTGYDISQSSNELKRIQSLSAEEFRKWNNEQKWKIARYHFDNNNYYRKKVKNNFPDKWEDLPMMKKSDYQDDLKKILSRGYSKKNTYIANTSGSSGHPFFFAKDKSAHSRAWAYTQRRYLELGIGKNSKEARFYGIPKELKGLFIEKIKDLLMNRVRFSIFDFSDNVLDSFIKKFSNTKFKYIYGYTSSIVQFSRYLIDRGIILKDLCPSLKLVIVTSEVCTKEDRRIIEEAIGISVMDEYGASEFGYIAWECRLRDWHIAEENIFLENTNEGKLLITDLHNRAMPFIRYEIGDIGFLSDKQCKCGFRSRVLSKIQGRTNDWVVLPSGKKSPGLTFYYISRSILETSGVLKEFIIRQIKLDTFIFEIVSDRALTDSETKKIQSKMDKYLEPHLTLIVKRVNAINRPESTKLKHFYSEII